MCICEFKRRLNKMIQESGMSIEQFARVLKISQGTAVRWMRGDSAPHTLGREAVFKTFM